MSIRLTSFGAKKPSDDPPPPPDFADLQSGAPSVDMPNVNTGVLLRLRAALRRTLEDKAAVPQPASRTVRKALDLCQQLLSERGEVSGSRLAREVLAAFQALAADGKESFFDHLAAAFSPDPESVGQAGLHYRKDPSPENLARLQRVVEPLRLELFRRMNMAPGATALLVDMRRQLLAGLPQHRNWTSIAADLAHLFSAWFNRGFLVLERIDWRTPAIVLEKLIRYEAVHEIQGWNDLRRRLAADRRCYAFFHPALPEDPIIFIEVALTRGISTAVQPLLDPNSPVLDPATADSANFYSITNCQEGLRGVPFGSFLIKQVVEDLTATLPRLRKYSTLSPIPGFRAWLEQNWNSFPQLTALSNAAKDSKWTRDPPLRSAMERQLVPLAAHYLLHAKQGRGPLDPVARFHLKNGARLERLNWMGDTSASGLARSFGLMANYVYRLGEVEHNHEQYTHDDRILTTHEVESLAKKVHPRPVRARPTE